MSLKIVVLDIEAVPNELALERLAAMHPAEPMATDQHAGWPKWLLHRIVAASALMVDEHRDGPEFKLLSWHAGRCEEDAIVAEVEERVSRASTLVTFNGRAYDLPLLRARAMAARSLPVPAIAAVVGGRSDRHVDLAQRLSGGNAASRPSLVELAAVLGLPAKAEVGGTSVPRLAAEGDYARVSRHCESDVITTWLAYAQLYVSDGGDRERFVTGVRAMERWLRAEQERLEHLQTFADVCERMARLAPADERPLPPDADLTF